MAGDSVMDMRFGKRLGMVTIFIGQGQELARKHPHLVDFSMPDLLTLAKALSEK
jgi:phosphoglycolate phosphatase-like HAD superfamily hydrolase